MKNNFKKLYTTIIVFILICILSPITTCEKQEGNFSYKNYEVIPFDEDPVPPFFVK